MRQSLFIAFEETVILAFSILVSLMDRNYNLHLLDPANPRGSRDMWLGLATDPLSWEPVAPGSPAGRKQVLWSASMMEYIRTGAQVCRINGDRTVEAFNDGVNRPMLCR